MENDQEEDTDGFEIYSFKVSQDFNFPQSSKWPSGFQLSSIVRTVRSGRLSAAFSAGWVGLGGGMVPGGGFSLGGGLRLRGGGGHSHLNIYYINLF